MKMDIRLVKISEDEKADRKIVDDLVRESKVTGKTPCEIVGSPVYVDENNWLGSGINRLEATKKLGYKEIEVEVRNPVN